MFEKIRESLQRSRVPPTETRAVRISLAVSMALLFIKFAAYFLTESTAIFSDAVESIANVMGSLMAFYWTIERGHEVAGAIEGEMARGLREAKATAHVEPCPGENCRLCQALKHTKPDLDAGVPASQGGLHII